MIEGNWAKISFGEDWKGDELLALIIGGLFQNEYKNRGENNTKEEMENNLNLQNLEIRNSSPNINKIRGFLWCSKLVINLNIIYFLVLYLKDLRITRNFH